MGFIPVSIDDYVKMHLKKNKGVNEKILRVRLEAALDGFVNGIKCACGNDLWVVGSAQSGNGCFSCITGKAHPAGDYEIESAINKVDKYGRRHIDEMDPARINGFFDDDGYEINPDSIRKPDLCLTCLRNYEPGVEDDILCNLNRIDQKGNKDFRCYSFIKL